MIIIIICLLMYYYVNVIDFNRFRRPPEAVILCNFAMQTFHGRLEPCVFRFHVVQSLQVGNIYTLACHRSNQSHR